MRINRLNNWSKVIIIYWIYSLPLKSCKLLWAIGRVDGTRFIEISRTEEFESVRFGNGSTVMGGEEGVEGGILWANSWSYWFWISKGERWQLFEISSFCEDAS